MGGVEPAAKVVGRGTIPPAVVAVPIRALRGERKKGGGGDNQHRAVRLRSDGHDVQGCHRGDGQNTPSSRSGGSGGRGGGPRAGRGRGLARDQGSGRNLGVARGLDKVGEDGSGEEESRSSGEEGVGEDHRRVGGDGGRRREEGVRMRRGRWVYAE